MHMQPNTHTHTHNKPIALPGPLKWSLIKSFDIIEAEDDT